MLVTEWNEFKFLDLVRLRGLLRTPVIFDGRNLWAPEQMRRLGVEYHSIGRRAVGAGGDDRSPAAGARPSFDSTSPPATGPDSISTVRPAPVDVHR